MTVIRTILLVLISFFGNYFDSTAQSLLSDDFNYTGVLSSNGWTVHSGSGTNAISTTSGLSYQSHTGSGVGNAALISNLGGEDINRTFTSQSTNGSSVYFSFLCNVTDPATSKTGDYFLHLGSPGGASWTTFSARVYARIVSGNVNFGLSNTNTVTYGTTNFSKNTTYLIVVKYTIATGTASDPITMWVIPSGTPVTEALAGTAEVIHTTTNGTDAINAIGLRQGGNTTSVQVVIDALRIGLDWSSVATFTLNAPSTQASNISFTNSSTSATTISWTNGNGDGRIVKMNTTNSFVSPSNGTTYVANSSYAGSGEQVVYVGSENSVTITNLIPGQTYYFQVFEYNTAGLLYNTNSSTNNPNTITLDYPIPVLTGINPSGANVGSSAFTLTVTGSNFYNTSIINWNSSPKTTTYVNSTTLTTVISEADLATAGTAAITVTNIAPGGGTTSVENFTINANGSPTITVTSSLTNLISEVFVASASQSYTISAGNLSDNILVTTNAPFELSLDNSTWSNTLTINQSGGAVNSMVVYVRLNASTSGAFNGTITHSSTGATNQTITLSGFVFASSPTVQSSIVSTTRTDNSLTFSLNGGNGSNHILVASTAPISFVPVDGSTPSGVNANWMLATDQGSSNKIVYNGSDTMVTVTGLSSNTTYHFAVYEYNGSSGTINYLQANPGILSASTLSAEPTTASILSVTRVTEDTIYLNFTGGTGAHRIVVVNTTGSVQFTPVDGTSYSGASTNIQSAVDLGGENKLVYQGSATSAKITGITSGSTISLSVFEYNGSGTATNYKTPGTSATAITPSFIAYTGGSYSQDFNSLPTSGAFSTGGFGQGPYFLTSSPINATMASGWQIASITGADVKLNTDNGTANVGSNYNYGSSGSTDRSVGCLASGSYKGSLGAVFTNNTTGPLNVVTITYNGENWRRGGSGNSNKLLFSYKVGESSIKAIGFTNVSSLDFSTPTPVSGTGNALDGNAPENKTLITATVHLDNNWMPGQALTIRWEDVDETGADDGLAIDDFTFVANYLDVPSPPVITSLSRTNTGLIISFNPPVNSGSAVISNYEYSLDNGNTWTTRMPASTITPIIIENGISICSTYNVKIRAVNSYGSGLPAELVTTQGLAPATPTITTGTPCNSYQLTANPTAGISQLIWRNNNIISSTVSNSWAGNGVVVAGGNGVGSGSNQLNKPSGVFVDDDGNVYVSEYFGHRVTKWSPGATSGVTVAGGNGQGAGPNQLNYPNGVQVDRDGNVYVSDYYNHRIQKWAPGATSGVTVAGGNGQGSGSNQLNFPTGIYIDLSGDMYISDGSNHRIQKWATGATTGVTVAGGNGFGSGLNQLNNPGGIHVSRQGDIFVSDGSNHRIIKFRTGFVNGEIVSGGNGAGSADWQLSSPTGVYVDGRGQMYIADQLNYRIKLDYYRAVGGNGIGAALNQFQPTGVFVDGAGNIYVSDYANNRILKFASTINNLQFVYSPGSYTVEAVSSNGCASVSAPVVVALPNSSDTNLAICTNQFPYVWNGVSYQAPGTYTWTGTNSYGCDSIATLNLSSKSLPSTPVISGSTCRGSTLSVNPYNFLQQFQWFQNNSLVSSSTYTTSTVAGGNGQGSGSNQLNFPTGIYIDLSGDMYISDESNHRIQKWAPGATAGVTVAGGNGGGSASNQLNTPIGVYVDGAGNIYVSDRQNHRIQKWTPGATTGVTVAGGNGGGSASNQFIFTQGIFVDGAGNIYVSDAYNHRIQKWAPGATYGITIAGGNGFGSGANQLWYPSGVYGDANGNIYISDYFNHRIQKWAPGATAGVTVAGGNGQGSASNQLNTPNGVYVDGAGNIYVSDAYNHRIQKWTPGATTGVTVAGGNGGGSGANQLFAPSGVFGDNNGNIYVSDAYNHRIQKISIPNNFTFSNAPAGTYTVTVTSPNGCSVTSAPLVVKQTDTSILNVSRCSNQLPYSWNGINYSTAGTYTWTGTNAAGCDSVAALNLTVNNTSTSTTSITVCSNQLPYSWNGNSYSNSGTYTYTTTSSTGCDSIATLNLTVSAFLATPVASVTQPTCATSTGTITVTTPTGVGFTYSIGGVYQSSPVFSGLTAGTYTISVLNASGCTSAATGTATVNPQPFVPATPTVTGPQNICNLIGTEQTATYVASTPGATSYTWTIPSFTQIVSGQGTNTLVVRFLNGFATQTVSTRPLYCKANSVCGSSINRIYSLYAVLPQTPRYITPSTADVCPSLGTGVPITYTTGKVQGSSSYIWTAQAGTTNITSVNGAGENDTVVAVTFESNFTTSSISVRAVNDCGVSSLRSITISRSNPATPALISGPTNACSFIGANGQVATYSVAALSAFETYNWTIPAGATDVTGSTTRTISFRYPVGYTGGTISVQRINGCGSSGTRSLSIGVLQATSPTSIDVVNTATCPNRVYTYSVSSMPAQATSLLWTIPSGGTIVSGQGTTSIVVSYTSGVIAGEITVRGVNNCSLGSLKRLGVKLQACPTGFAGGDGTLTKGNTATAVTPMEVQVFPNPSAEAFNLQVITAAKETVRVRVLDVSGRFIRSYTIAPNITLNLGTELKAGTYLLEIVQGKSRQVSRVVKY